ncbi:MAG: hypothetical protein Q4D17_08810, partial [Planctomycetia bacterium]|nr:hypothetical protein [Planctomycetia bacterium]
KSRKNQGGSPPKKRKEQNFIFPIVIIQNFNIFFFKISPFTKIFKQKKFPPLYIAQKRSKINLGWFCAEKNFRKTSFA